MTIVTGGIFKYNYATGGGNILPAIYGCSWVTMNGTKLDWTIGSPEINGSYVFALGAGNYEFELKVETNSERLYSYGPPPDYVRMVIIHHPGIQAMVILSDTTTDALAEQPPERNDTYPASLIASGPSITVPGCIEVRDIAGRIVCNEIKDGRITLSTLPKGTYFAQTSTLRIIKIVKM